MRTKNRFALAALAAVCALGAAGVAPAGAGAPPGTTVVEIFGTQSDPQNGNRIVVGRVAARPPACAKNRRVTVATGSGDSFEQNDSGRTTDRGYFALGVPVILAETRVVAVRQKVKVRGETVVCKRASDSLFIE